MAGGDDLIDERRPVVRPFLLQYRDEDQVQLVQESSLGSKLLFGAGGLDDEVNDEVSNSYYQSALRRIQNRGTIPTLTLFFWQDIPSGHNDIIEYLQAQIYNLSAALVQEIL